VMPRIHPQLAMGERYLGFTGSERQANK
jgi:hypothetical protein